MFLITTQRFLTVCHSHGNLNFVSFLITNPYHLITRMSFQRLNQCPPGLLILGHWLLSLLIYLPALLNSDAYFENEITLFIVASKTHQQVGAESLGTLEVQDSESWGP